jgi:hypothetical protein
MATYYVENGILTVNGNTFCGGSPCTASDTIIIRGGDRGSIWFKNFNGSGSYIPIMNENINPDSRAIIKSSSQSAFLIEDCKYVDFRGDNDPDTTYGIKSINDGSPVSANNVRILGQSDHIKIGYFEMAFDGNTSGSGNGIFVQDSTESSSWTWDNIELHHNYIHGCRYAGMYLGHTNPLGDSNPYISNVSVHDNIIDDSGAYGMVLKGVSSSSGTCSIYNNTIRTTGLVYTGSDEKKTGISVHTFYGSTAYANIYNNRVEHTVGVGIRVGKSRHQIYNNEVLGCGTGNDVKYGQGIITYYSADDTNIYDNIIIQPKRYGIYSLSGAIANGTTLSRNLIGDAGIGEWGEEVSGKIIESSGEDANWYEADVASFGFNAWSDDGDYSNDDFGFGGSIPYTRSRGILRQKPRYNVPGGRFR